MSIGRALIGKEMDDSVDLTPGHMFYQCITLLFIGGDVFSFRNAGLALADRQFVIGERI